MTRAIAPAEISRRLREVARAVDEGCSRTVAAQRLGITPAGLITFLSRHDFTGWPLDPAKLLARAVEVDNGATIEVAPRRQSGARKVGEIAFPAEQVAEMREAAERERAERERYWLDQERAKYGLARRGKPISGMVA